LVRQKESGIEVSPRQAAEYHSVDLHNPNRNRYRNRSNIKLLHKKPDGYSLLKKPCRLGSYLNGLSAFDPDSDFDFDFDKPIFSQQAAGNQTLKEIENRNSFVSHDVR
jgi:hypothetical protein